MKDSIRLDSDGASAVISKVGAEPVEWSVGGRDVLWKAQPNLWPRTSPILFPVVGRCRDSRIMVKGKSYPMDIHGFASAMVFELVHRSQSEATFVLEHDETTLSHYPFAFRLQVTYRLGRDFLTAEFEVLNAGDHELPYAIGIHPGFRWASSSAERDGSFVEFDCTENPEIPIITDTGLFSKTTRTVPLDGRRLALTDRLLRDEALCFLNVRSRSLRFVANDGMIVGIEVENFPHFAVWTIPGAPFLSIETWTGHGDPEDFEGDLSAKPSMRHLPPDCRARHVVRFDYQEPAS